MRFDPSRLDLDSTVYRRTLVATLVLLMVGPASMLMADLHWRTGFDLWKIAHLCVFIVLFTLLALGTAQAIVGFFLRRSGGDSCNILHSVEPEEGGTEMEAATAILMPICNEEVSRVMEGLRATYESLAATGHLANFDFFLLSDSNDPNHWVEEEAAWLALTRELGAHGRIFYRKRRLGTNKKAGNLADFCRRWGSYYKYMVVLDADSIMTGAAVVQLVRVMECNAGVGIVQGVPQLANGETIFARLQQFSSRLYGPIYAAGMNFWQLGEANYWGHNAIIRTAPFIEHCSLPDLPGDGPFGGRIMSHDYVEAALMRRAGWQVWLAIDLEGNFEESPANLIDFAKRDRRWLQGNLQHTRLLAARGFHAINRVHFALGILSYAASPLWLAFLLLSTLIGSEQGAGGLANHPAPSFDSYLPWSVHAQAVFLFVLTVGLIFVPKILALLDLKSRPDGVAAFGGWKIVGQGVALEIAITTLLAPVLMFFHTKFFLLTLWGQSVAWGKQRRGRAGEAEWRETAAVHASHTLVGCGWAFVAYKISPTMAVWLGPVLVGLILSIPVSFLVGFLPLGLAVKNRGLFVTPDESQPPPELLRLAERLAAPHLQRPAASELATDYGLLQAVLDPYVNAVHIALLRVKDDPPPASEERFAMLRDKLLREGPVALSTRDKTSLLLDADSMTALHRELWASPRYRLADWWTLALEHYNVIAPPPQTPFSRRPPNLKDGGQRAA